MVSCDTHCVTGNVISYTEAGDRGTWDVQGIMQKWLKR